MSRRSVRHFPLSTCRALTGQAWTYLAQRVGDLLLLADVSRVERHVVVALNDVEDGHGVPAGEKGFDNVPSEKAAAADDQVDVSLASRHGGMWREERRRPV